MRKISWYGNYLSYSAILLANFVVFNFYFHVLLVKGIYVHNFFPVFRCGKCLIFIKFRFILEKVWVVEGISRHYS